MPMPTDTSAAPAVETRNLTKIFRTPLARLRRLARLRVREVTAVRGVSLAIARGEIFGLVGRNGQGKTTLIKAIATLIRPTSGEVRVFGADMERHGDEVRQRIGLVSSDERSFYFRLTGRQNLMYFARLYGMNGRAARARIEALAAVFDFAEMLDRRYQELSTGNKQRLALMRALLNDPPLLLLDEPTRSLDPMAAEDLRRLIRDNLNRVHGKTIFITSHNLAEVEDLCGRIGILHRGELRMCATMDELRRDYCNREQVTLRLRGLPAWNGLAELRGDLSREIPTLQWRPLAAAGVAPDPGTSAAPDHGTPGAGAQWEVTFTRALDDDLLDRVIARVHAAGGRIDACLARRGGLLDILGALDDAEPQAEPAPPRPEPAGVAAPAPDPEKEDR
ncbi:MAG: ABC transporter ATP-binding protein [bacterium]|nr:ABC transporter ATP-binding protein [bacterium]